MAGRRGQGEGGISRRKDGLWEARVSLGRGPDGNRVRKSFYGPTRREVAEKLAAALRDHQLGALAPRRGESVSDFLSYWLEEVVRPRVRPKTYAHYRHLVSMHIVPALGRRQVARLTPQEVQAMLNAKARSGLAPRTVHHMRAVLRNALSHAVKIGLVGRNVAALADSPSLPAVADGIRVLAPDEARLLLEAAVGHRLEALFVVALSLGLRQGEALGLRWQDVDLDSGMLSVRHALQRLDGELTLVEPKSARSRRTVQMPKMVADRLREHRKRQLADRLLAGGRWQQTDFVFTSTVGTPLGPDAARYIFEKLLEKAGLPPMRFHDLRHSCASLLLAQGIPARVVMETLGHSSITLTMNTYSHVMPAVQREAADAMDRLFGG